MQLIPVAYAAEEGLSIHLAPDVVTTVFGVPITSTLLTVWLSMLFLTILAIVVKGKLRMVPGRLQNFIEILIGGVFDYIAGVLESEKMALRFFPLIMTIFLFILTTVVF